MGMLPRSKAIKTTRRSKPVGLDAPRLERSGVLKRVEQILGASRLTSDQDLVTLVEGRLATGTIDRLHASGLTDDEIHALIIPRRTLTHRRTRREPLSRDESDRVIRVARIAALGEEVFGDQDRSLRWLRTDKRQLQGRSPLQLVTTEAGARVVEELLHRIDEGMAA